MKKSASVLLFRLFSFQPTKNVSAVICFTGGLWVVATIFSRICVYASTLVGQTAARTVLTDGI